MTLAAAVADQPFLPLWMTHIWQRLHDHRRLGLVLGAGVSIDAGCPSWAGLVKLLSRRAGTVHTMNQHRKKGFQEAYLAQMLKRYYAEEYIARHGASGGEFLQTEINSAWMSAVHDALYGKMKGLTFDEIASRHGYLRQLGELVAHTTFTVNFNFDDIVDEAAFNHIQAEARTQTKDRKPPAPEVIWRPKVENRRGAPVIYHVNGYLPREPIRRKSGSLTLTEDAFADILVSPNSSDTEFVASRFASMTFLLIGTSLTDNSLKNMLRIGALRSPANHHYIIYWEDDKNPSSANQKTDIFGVNLDVYNLMAPLIFA